MLEQSKAAKRRFFNGNFHNRYFKGKGIDIGGKPDPFSQYIGVFPLVNSVKIWDLEDGDAQYMSSCLDNTFDFVVSSHCLEHMVDVYEALKNWIRILKEGAYLIITIPDEDLYEQNQWPSNYNSDHKHTFTIHKRKSWSSKSINVLDLLITFSDYIEIETIQQINDFYNFNIEKTDQTIHPNIEACIEIILKKKETTATDLYDNNRYWMPITPQKNDSSVLASFNFKVEYLFNLNKNYILYGYGNSGKLLHKSLINNIYGIIDTKSTIIDKNINKDTIYSPLNIKNMHYDYIIITPIDNENKIELYLMKTLYIPKEKIIHLNSIKDNSK